jgi:pilus assembly protein Flp/PilA
MSKIVQQAKKFLRDEEGVTAIEYGLLASLVAIAIISGATLLGGNLNTLFSSIGTKVG